MTTNIMEKDSRRQPIEKYQDSDISLTFPFFITNIVYSPWRDSKVKTKEFVMITYLKNVTAINVTNQRKLLLDETQRSQYDREIPIFLFQNLKDQFNYNGDLNYLEFLDFCDAEEICIYKSTVGLVCSFCGEPINMRIVNEPKRLLNRTYAKEYIACKKKKCQANLRVQINRIQTESGHSSGLGKHQMHVDWHEAHMPGLLKAGERRRGKTIDELYGKEVADRVRQQMSEKNKQYVIDHGHGPHCSPHSEETKEKMRHSKQKFLKTRAYEKNYINPFNTEEKVDWFSWNSLSKKHYFENLSQEEKIKHSLNTIKGMQNNYNYDTHPNWGYHTPWWRKLYSEYVQYEYDEAYQSKLELDYYKVLDKDQVFYQNNNTVYLPYVHPKDGRTHYYVPDVLIFENYQFHKIIQIIEIKPYEFAYNPDQRGNEYYLTTQRKLCALRMYCLTNSIQCTIITEKEVYENEDTKN